MQLSEVEDSYSLNELVEIKPVTFNSKKTASSILHPSQDNIGIYQDIKLTHLLPVRDGKLIEFVTLAPNTYNKHATFVSKQAQDLLSCYSTDQIAFVVVIGRQKVGKSFFCDKLLNLAEVKGNHFCRNNKPGLKIWSAPFEKQNMKIFILQISGYSLNSQQFKRLSTYALLISSAFIIIQNPFKKRDDTLAEVDAAFQDIVNKITPSKINQQVEIRNNRNVFMPKLIYDLKRDSQSQQRSNLSIINLPIELNLPDALSTSYGGSKTDLLHTSFLDTSCINQSYIRQVSKIFKQIYNSLEQKRYNQLLLNGNIILKIIKYIQKYLNGQKSLNIEQLYQKIIEDLYLSAYNYCILLYHDEMERQFQNQQPKPLEELLQVFERVSQQVTDKFQQFSLDQTLHEAYMTKLQNHISQKQIIILDINRKKTQIELNKLANVNQMNTIDKYNQFIKAAEKQGKDLTHGRSDVIGKISTDYYLQMRNNNNIDFKLGVAIAELKVKIAQKQQQYEVQKNIYAEKSKERSAINEETETYRKKQKALQQKLRELTNDFNQMKNSLLVPATCENLKSQIVNLQGQIGKLLTILSSKEKKNNQIITRQNKLEEIKKKIVIQENLIKELKETTKQQPAESIPKQNKNQKDKPAASNTSQSKLKQQPTLPKNEPQRKKSVKQSQVKS